MYSYLKLFILVVPLLGFPLETNDENLDGRVESFCQHLQNDESILCRAGSSNFAEIITNMPLSLKQLTFDSWNFQVPISPFNSSFPYNLSALAIYRSNINRLGLIESRALPNLILLNCSGNNIHLISSSFTLFNLKILNLSSNDIHEVSRQEFAGFPSLKVLDLHNNKLTFLPSDLFFFNTNLEWISLENNAIEYLHSATLNSSFNLKYINIMNNNLHILDKNVIELLLTVPQVELAGNALDCSCGIDWAYLNRSRLAEELKRVCGPVLEPQCSAPKITAVLPHDTLLIQRMHRAMLHCHSVGYPRPSIYWITPRGILALPHQRKYVQSNIKKFDVLHKFQGIPLLVDSTLHILPNGSLVVENMRNYFSGNFVCVAENPVGISSHGFKVRVWIALKKEVIYSMIVGGITAGTFLVCSLVFALFRLCCGKVSQVIAQRKNNAKCDVSETDCLTQASMSSSDSFDYLNYESSPFKMMTPIEEEEEYGEYDERASSAHILGTLVDVRELLKNNVEKSKERLRTRAFALKESSSSYMISLRENSSHKLKDLCSTSTAKLGTFKQSSNAYYHNIKASSSELSNRMKTGVVIGVETVKYTVQSMKELCGTGDIGQTISAVSISTNIDTQESSEIVRHVTLV